ncbi:MAG: VOC family protein [Hyphomicrobiaceae bacterium]
MVKSTSAVPRGYQAVMPYLRVRDAAAAIKFYKKALGATESYRLKMANKVGHAEMSIGGAVFMLSDEFPDHKAVGPKSLKGTSVALALYVDDVDKAVMKATKAGAKVRQKVADQFYGDRVGQIVDPFGHVWSIHTRLESVDPKEMQKRLNGMMREATKKPAAAKKAGKAAKGAKAAKAGRKASAGAKAAAGKRPATRKTAAKRLAAKPVSVTRSVARKPIGNRRKAASVRRGRARR